jgi:hypothetical protein
MVIAFSTTIIALGDGMTDEVERVWTEVIVA